MSKFIVLGASALIFLLTGTLSASAFAGNQRYDGRVCAE